MKRLIFIIGGARSGKSTFAQELARARGHDQVLYVATADAGDDEMQRRIEMHRRERPEAWRTVETRRRVGLAILECADDATVVLIDCLSLLVSNVLLEADGPFAPATEEAVMQEVEELLACLEARDVDAIVVSNEVGMGVVPASPLGRAYRDVLGWANQHVAYRADEVYLMTAGIPRQIK